MLSPDQRTRLSALASNVVSDAIGLHGRSRMTDGDAAARDVIFETLCALESAAVRQSALEDAIRRSVEQASEPHVALYAHDDDSARVAA